MNRASRPLSLAREAGVYELVEQRIAGWAGGREDVQAVIVVGSRARIDHPADRWSDLDLIVFVSGVDPYRQSGDWQPALQAAFPLPVWLSAFDTTGRGDPEWEFVLEGGVKVDLVFTLNRSPRGKEATLAEMVESFPYRYVLEDGMRALVEKTSGPPVQLGPPPVQVLPSAAEYKALIDNTLLNVVRAVKLSKRGELWRAVQVINTALQGQVLKLLVWHAAARSFPGGVPYYRGRFLEEWADPRMLAQAADTLAGYSNESVRRAVEGVFRFITAVTAEIYQAAGLAYPQGTIEHLRNWATDLVSQDG